MRLNGLLGIVLALASPSTGTALSEWTTLPNSPSAGSRHDDVWFIDELTGWVVNGDGEIWNTSDGGDSWQLQADLTVYLRAVTFATPLHGWAGSLYSLDRLYETTNGGSTWNLVTGLPAEFPLGICGMWAASEDVVYAVGRYAMPAAVLKTTDAGASWSYITIPARTLVDCYFPNPDVGYAVGSVGTFPDSSRAVVLRTTNGGVSWQTQHTSSGLGEWAWKISFPSALTGYVSVERGSGPMIFLKTTDGGITWTEKSCPNFNEQGIGFLNDNVGWLGGWGNPTYSTTDGGDTWQTLNFMMQNLNRIRFVGDGIAYAVGKRVYRYGPDPTGVPDVFAAESGALSESSPNPFSTSASIGFTLLHPEHVKLEVFDVAGRCVRTILDSPASAGIHRAVWNGRDAAGTLAPTGVYFWKLETKSRSEPRKMLLVR